jgi:hypothetical protein
MLKVFAALDVARRDDLTADLLSVLARTNEADDGTMVAPSGYLEVVITKR